MERSRRPAAGRQGWLVLLMILATVVAGCSSKSEDQLAADALAAGLQAHSAGQLDVAASDYREVLKHDPRNKFAYFNLGVIDQTQGRLASAENNYRISLSIDSEFGSAIWNLALLRGAAGAPAEAINLWRRYLKLANAAGAHYNLAIQLRAIGNTADGNAEMALALQLDPTLVEPGAPSPSASPAPPATAAPSPGSSPSAPATAGPSASGAAPTPRRTHASPSPTP